MDKKPVGMKNSEIILYQYLTSWRQGVEYNKQVGSRRPDFSIWDSEGKPEVFWEMADRRLKDEDRRRIELERERMYRGETVITGGKSEGAKLIERKIFKKSKQFEECGGLPGLLVLADWTGDAYMSGTDVSIAFEGWPGVRIPIGNSEQPLEFCRTDRGKMVKDRGSEQNNHISAVGVLSLKLVNQYVYGLNDFGVRVHEEMDANAAYDAYMAEDKRQRNEGIHLDQAVPVLDIYRNRNAHYHWPVHLHGPYDRVYNVVADSLEPVLIYDGLKPHRTIEIKKSRAQLDIESLMKDPNLRNG